MARGVNKVILIGHLGQDPQVRHTQDNRTVTNLRVATTDQWTDRTSGDRREATEWHRVVCFGRTAEIAEQYLRKGSMIYVEGSLRTSSYEREGVKHYNTDVIARTVNMLDSRRSSESGDHGGGYEGRNDNRGAHSPRSSSDQSSSSGQDTSMQQDSSFEDDIPF